MTWWMWLLFGAAAVLVLAVLAVLGWGYWVMRRDTGRGARA